ncbi:uncharacterized protein MCYG_03871 [Microsporum canis CBS 113480]|uniref:Uncharacterized protein n=1 Tax=Arthroderma otae (strain ATCC MYA-4605 / CBS 113480) TaxID=554155 RepID=C5FME9_ARTOC|nr:uncharacterized protein MCYG_03871 [Microsporum canis CBS 113480]EEQ31052.1 predicted protein [Microsporum canis CBS 113480]
MARDEESPAGFRMKSNPFVIRVTSKQESNCKFSKLAFRLDQINVLGRAESVAIRRGKDTLITHGIIGEPLEDIKQKLGNKAHPLFKDTSRYIDIWCIS